MEDGQQIIDQVGPYASAGLLGCTVRELVSGNRYTIAGRLRAYTIMVFVVWMCVNFLSDTHFTGDTKIGICGLCALLADDIVQAVIRIGQKLLGKPLEILIDFVRK